MKKFLKFLVSLVVRSIVFAVFITLLSLTLELFFEGAATFENFSAIDLFKTYLHNLALFLFLFTLLNFVIIGRPERSLGNKPLTTFTKTLIIFPGLPLFGMIFSMYFVRLFELFGLSISPTTIVITATITFWGYGAYLCKTVFFKNNT